MEELDTKKLARVWNRVRGIETADDLQQMVELTQAAALHCRAMARKFTGPRHRLLLRMAQQNQAAMHCLLGICRLNSCSHTPLPHSIPAASVRQRLLDCHTCLQQLAGMCDTHTGHPQFGHIYSRLGSQSRTHCRQLLQLLGMQD